MTPFLMCAVTAALLAACDLPKEHSTKELIDKLQGTWLAESYIQDGKRISDQADGLTTSVKIEIKGDKLAWVQVTSGKGKAIGVELQFDVKLDPTKKPVEMDLVFTGEKDQACTKSKLIRAILKLDGDTLKIAVCWTDGRRPKKFKSDANSGNSVLLLKRKKE